MLSITKVNSQSQSHTWHCCCSVFISSWGAEGAAWRPPSPRLCGRTQLQPWLFSPILYFHWDLHLHLGLPGAGQGVLPQGTTPVLSSGFHQCLVLYHSVQRGYRDTIWIIPVVDSSHLHIFLIAFKDFTAGLLLGDDHLLQPGLLSVWEGSNTCCHRFQGQKELLWFETTSQGKGSFPFLLGGAWGFHCLLRAQTHRTDSLVLVAALRPPRQPLLSMGK